MTRDLRRLKTACNVIGASVLNERVGESWTCEVFAPARMLWKASGNHCMTDSAYHPWRPDYADLLNRVKMGVEPCTDPECEWCNEEPETEERNPS